MPSKNIPVNGWPQLKDLEAVQPTLDRLDKIEAWKRTVKEETFTGEEITIPNALALPATSLVTTINAIQDLHGYDKPWAGGAYKNKLPMTVDNIKSWNGGASSWSGNSKVISGVTWAIVTDNDGNVTGIKANDTASATSLLQVSDTMSFTEGDKINGAIGGSSHTYGIGASGAGMVQTDGDYTITAAFATGTKYLYCRVNNGVTVSNKMFYPMLRNPSESADFAPYSNICPISGRTAVVVNRSDGDEISEDFTIQLGTTVYGGEVNWETGVMTVKTTLVDNGTLTWVEQETAVSNKKRFYAILSPSAVAATSVALTSKSSQYSLLPPGGTYPATADGYTITDDDRLYIYDEAYSSATTADFKTAMSGVQTEYTLDTPTTIQLTPTQLEMLKGYNHITLTDRYGNIELKALTGANWS